MQDKEQDVASQHSVQSAAATRVTATLYSQLKLTPWCCNAGGNAQADLVGETRGAQIRDQKVRAGVFCLQGAGPQPAQVPSAAGDWRGEES